MEDALDAVLREQQLGCVIGTGIGLRYSYIDFALVGSGLPLPVGCGGG